MKVQLPDGKIAEFPDDISQGEVEAAIRERYSQKNPSVSNDPYTDFGNDGPISAITGKPIQSGMEKLQQSADAVRAIGPIVGDIALSAAAPQFGGAGMGIRALNALFRSAGAGAGSYIGAKAGDILSPDKKDTAVRQGLVGAGTDLGFSALTGIAAPAVKKAAEVASEVTGTGKMVKQWLGRKHASKFLSDFGITSSKTEAGLEIGNLFANKADEASSLYKAYGKSIEEAANKQGGAIYLDDTTQYLSDMLEARIAAGANPSDARAAVLDLLGTDPKKYDGKVMLYLMNNDSIAPKDVKNFLSSFWGNWKKLTQPEISAREKLKTVLKEDLAKIQSEATGQTAAAILDQADILYGKTKELLGKSPTIDRWIKKSKVSPTLKGFEYAPETFVDSIFNKATADEIGVIRDTIKSEKNGAATWAMLEFQYIKGMFGKYTKQMDSGRSFIQGPGLADEIRQNEKWIKTVFGETTWKKLKSEADFYGTIAVELPGGIQRAAGASIGLASGGIGGAAIAEGIGAASAWAVMSPHARKAIMGVVKSSKPALKAFSHTVANDTN